MGIKKKLIIRRSTRESNENSVRLASSHAEYYVRGLLFILSTAWDCGKKALNLEQSQMHMIDDVIEKLDIKDGDNILGLGCGVGCVPYILSKFPMSSLRS